MTGDKNEGNMAHVERKEYDDDLEPAGSGPNVVLTQSRKMSIYGPNFNYGPIQLRRQRLLEKMKKEAEETMAKKIEELKAAQRVLDEQVRMKKLMEQQYNDENRNQQIYQQQYQLHYQHQYEQQRHQYQMHLQEPYQQYQLHYQPQDSVYAHKQ